MGVIVDFSIFPMDKGESVGRYVAKVVEEIRKSGVEYRVGPMGTCMEGDWDRIMEVVSSCLKQMQLESNRVYMTLKVDARKGDGSRMSGKLDSVMKIQE